VPELPEVETVRQSESSHPEAGITGGDVLMLAPSPIRFQVSEFLAGVKEQRSVAPSWQMLLAELPFTATTSWRVRCTSTYDRSAAVAVSG